MARTLRGCPTAWLQPEGIKEPETNPSAPQQEDQTGIKYDKVVADNELDISKNEPVAQEEEENSNTDYAKNGVNLTGDVVPMN